MGVLIKTTTHFFPIQNSLLMGNEALKGRKCDEWNYTEKME